MKQMNDKVYIQGNTAYFRNVCYCLDNKFGLFKTVRGLCLSSPPLPGKPMNHQDALVLATRLVIVCESRMFEFRNMLIAENLFSVRYAQVQDLNGMRGVEVLRPPQPGGPFTLSEGLNLAFWISNFAEKKSEIDHLIPYLESKTLSELPVF